MILSRGNLSKIAHHQLSVPKEEVFDLPVKVLQFGTGVLLRALPDYFIHKANNLGLFNGKIVVVKSTDHGESGNFETQDGLYTILFQGIKDGVESREQVICGAISQVLSAGAEWDKVLALMYNPDLQVIISNTTEIGIRLREERIDAEPPQSFPAKLLALLFHRYLLFDGDPEKGFVVIPTELIPSNGRVLHEIICKLAAYNGLDTHFLRWLNEANTFCDSLVDRIVPGKPAPGDQVLFEMTAGYRDQLMITAEPYGLWAIEGDARVRDLLSFALADSGVVITDNIWRYRELKLRLLNGTHSLCCGMAILCGFTTVSAAVADPQFNGFITQLMADIAAAIPDSIDQAEARAYSKQVMDRFRNPSIAHHWESVAREYTTKLRMRVVPLLSVYETRNLSIPATIAKGFAAFLIYMRSSPAEELYRGKYKHQIYLIADEHAGQLAAIWEKFGPEVIADRVLGQTDLWGSDLRVIPGFASSVQYHVDAFLTDAPINPDVTYKPTR